MTIQSVNPFTQEVIKKYDPLDSKTLNHKIDIAHQSFKEWRFTSIDERIQLFKKLSLILKNNKERLGKVITTEIGRPIGGSIKEIEKCARNADYFSEHIQEFLKPEIVNTEYSESYITFSPIGPILLVMPWNFPFWQVLRQAIPTIIGGNTVILKHSSNVPQSALLIEEMFKNAGFPEGIFQTLLINSNQVEDVLSNFKVKGVSLTGGTHAGSAVASLAGKYLKRQVLELGGNDPFIVFEDADINLASQSCTTARLNNTGQVCNAPKRIILMENIAEEFINNVKIIYKSKIMGDPMDSDTDLGPLSSKLALENVETQVNQSIKQGAELIMGGGRSTLMNGLFFEPTILLLNKDKDARTLHDSDIFAYHHEIFGPVISVIIVNSKEQAISIANDTKYGLAASLWTSDVAGSKKYIKQINAGGVNINKNVSSDPRLPVGGVNISGYGKELSRYGLLSFMNAKSTIIENFH